MAELMLADLQRRTDNLIDDVRSVPGYEAVVAIVEQARAALARTPEPQGEAADVAWDRLRDDIATTFARQAYNQPLGTADNVIARNRLRIEAALRARTEAPPVRMAELEQARILDFALDGVKDDNIGPRQASVLAAATEAPGLPLDVETLAAALHEMEGPGRHSRPRLTRMICNGPYLHDADAAKVATEYARLRATASDRP